MRSIFRLNNIAFGRAWCAAGTRNFFGQGWPHHRFLRPNFSGSTLVCKTTTLDARAGNMPLRDDLMPRDAIPGCIKVNLYRAAVLNAVGLSGPGLETLLEMGSWQSIPRPFVFSFMAVASDPVGRLEESHRFAERLRIELPKFKASFAIEVNLSCPNVGTDPEMLVGNAKEVLRAMNDALPDVPLIPKFNLLVPAPVAAEISTSSYCSAVACSNTIPYGSLVDGIDWEALFGLVSPLARLGGGGLSGAPLTSPVLRWAEAYCSLPHVAPLIACGGVMRPSDAVSLLNVGASAVEIGSVAIVRPWRVRSIIRAINSWRET